MVHEVITNWLHASPLTELTTKYGVQDNTGLFPAYIIYVSPIRMPVNMLDGVYSSATSAQEILEMQEIQELVYKHLLHAQKSQKPQTDKYHMEVECVVG